MKFKAVVFDRDGTLNRCASRDLYYVTKPEQVELFDGVKEALTLLRKQNILPFVFTQQNGISKLDWPEMTEEALEAVHVRFQKLLGKEAAIEAFYHAPSPDHPLAKPGAGMLRAIMKDYRLNAGEVLVVGDSKRDYEAAKEAGMDFVLMQLEGEKENFSTPTVNSFESLNEYLKEAISQT